MNVRPPAPDPYPDPYSGGYQPPPPPTSPPARYGYAAPAPPAPGYRPGPSQPVTYRPTRQIKTTLTAGGAGVGVVGLALIAWRLFVAFERGGVDELLVVVAGVIVLLGVILGFYALYLRTLSITVEAGGVTRRVFGRARRIPRGVLQRAVLVSYTQQSRSSSTEVPLLALLDAGGRSRLTLNLQTWAESDAQALVTQLGLMGSVTSLGHRSIRQLKREVPGALPWIVAHRIATVFIVLGITLVLIVGISVVLVLATGGGS